MKHYTFFIFTTALLITLFLASTSEAQRNHNLNIRTNSRNSVGSINGGFIFDGDNISVYRPGRRTSVEKNPCFPYDCRGITKEKTNPDPRSTEEQPSCYYSRDGTLLYEREGKNCEYENHFNSYLSRVEKRKQEFLRAKREEQSSSILEVGLEDRSFKGSLDTSKWSAPRENTKKEIDKEEKPSSIKKGIKAWITNLF